MPLLNYTTTVESAKTVSEIEKILVAHGASEINKKYDGAGVIVALSFMVKTPAGEMPVRLPINIEAVARILLKIASNKRGAYGYVSEEKKAAIKIQAIKVAWRILKDWVEAQMAILETEMVTIDQILLSYIETASGKTVYQLFADRSQFLLGQGQG